ncbi:hypothetical protein KLPP_36320 [Klebsiella pneumoniae subsp. pneumoniae]|nr:hypothetical protein KLPP_36320 [Klebsiella pneumoniae subsp. pneumoniae]
MSKADKHFDRHSGGISGVESRYRLHQVIRVYPVSPKSFPNGIAKLRCIGFSRIQIQR